MTSYYVEITFELGVPESEQARADFEAHLDDVADALSDLQDVDGDVGADLESGRVDLCMTLEASERIEALTRAVASARTAIHAAGGATPGWEKMLAKLLDDDNYVLRSAPSAAASSYLG